MKAVIEFTEVRRHFGRREVLRGLSFEVGPGEVFGLLGRNGSGKTTALRALLGFLSPHGGACHVFGVDSRALTPELRERIGFVSERHTLYGYRTIQETLGYERVTRRRFDSGYARRQLDRCQIAMQQKVGTLSAGKRAQLAIVLAFAGRPDLLVFDDPALGLDAVARRELLDALIELLAEVGASVLFTGHVIADVERIAERVGILHGGRLLVDATFEELRRNAQRRFLRTDAPTLSIGDPAVVEVRRHLDGHELTLLAPSNELLAQLAVIGDLHAPQRLSTEDLFIALTCDHTGLLPDIPEEMASR